MPDGRKQTVTESQVIMELIDNLHTPDAGYKAMMPEDPALYEKHQQLARLERDLFSYWCNLVFRPEGGGRGSGGGGMSSLMGSIMGNNNDGEMSAAMKGFMQCMDKVDAALLETSGPFFLGSDYPMMIDLIFVSHIERMLASVAYWKGLQIRGSGRWKGIDAWFDAFDQRDSYLGFKSDFYTNVMDIPPQYGPGYDGGFANKREEYQAMIVGRDGNKSWNLPLEHDAGPLEPLFHGPPLPMCALDAAGISDYRASDPAAMAKACRQAAGWKLASNGVNVSRFAARGGSKGAKNPRKTFQAPLADPYANPDDSALPLVERTLQIVCEALLDDGDDHDSILSALKVELSGAVSAVDAGVKADVMNSLAYLRDRVGVPRDMPLAAARHLRAHLNWATGVLLG